MGCRWSATTSMSFRPELICPSSTAPYTSRSHRHVTAPVFPSTSCLHSVAEECGARAICVILSGTGSDGSLGLKAVKDKGGLVIAQDPDEASYDGMPRSAMLTGSRGPRASGGRDP